MEPPQDRTFASTSIGLVARRTPRGRTSPKKRERRKTLDDFWSILLTETYRKRPFPVKPCAQKKSVGGVKKNCRRRASPPLGGGGKEHQRSPRQRRRFWVLTPRLRRLATRKRKRRRADAGSRKYYHELGPAWLPMASINL